MIEAKVIEDSINPYGMRLTTFQLRYPKFIHAEFMTHKMVSKCAASSRAKPVHKIIEEIREAPARPVFWGAQQSGMQARAPLTGDALHSAKLAWDNARTAALMYSERCAEFGLHKQLANRLTEPFVHIDVVATATKPGWENFFALRHEVLWTLHDMNLEVGGIHESDPEKLYLKAAKKAERDGSPLNAQPEMFMLADAMLHEMRASFPHRRAVGEWHLPYVAPEERMLWTPFDQLQRSVACCARTSYSNHDKTVPNIAKDRERYHDLAKSGHWSPFEHQAQVLPEPSNSGNFERGWAQYRKQFSGERRTFTI